MNVDDASSETLAPSLARLTELSRAHRGRMSDLQDAKCLHAVVAGFEQSQGSAHSLRRRWLACSVAVAALALVAFALGPTLVGAKPLTYSITQGELQTGTYFRSGPGSQSSIRFSEGTDVCLTAGTRGRVASVDAQGARITLDEGEARVQVVPRPKARWLFDAGPFVIHVQGTEFVLAWNGEEGRLDLRLHKGAVTVTGPVSDGAIALRPGQWLTVRLSSREVFLREFDRSAPLALPRDVRLASGALPLTNPSLQPSAELSPEPATSTAPALDHAGGRQPARASLGQSSDKQPSFASALAEGDWNRILRLAEQRGLERTLAERSSEDLALLADAAHYLHRDEVAKQALLAQRRRFPGSTRAKDASFLLGRIVEARPDGASEALGWYERHLEEAPTGEYASEALGRRMIVLVKLRGEADARVVAKEYLRRYPNGSYARAARAYAREP